MTGVTGRKSWLVLRIGLESTSVVVPTTALTGVVTALVAKPIGLVIKLPHPHKHTVERINNRETKTSLLMHLTSSNQLAFAI